MAKLTKKQAATAKGQKCECGCGGTTKGGRFLAGHDAKLKSRLINTALGDSHVENRRDAQAQLGKLGWAEFLKKSRKGRDAKAAEKKAAKA